MSRHAHAHADDRHPVRPSAAQQVAGLGLFDQTPPTPAHAPGSATSKRAAEKIESHAQILRRRVLRAIVHSRGMGLTADQAAAWLGETPFAVRPRCTELKQARLIEESGRRDRNASGASAVVLVATELGRRVAADPANPSDPRSEVA